jgi:glycosidase
MKRWFISVLMIISTQVAYSAVDRVEPPHWWIGMRDPTLQLVIEGSGVAALQPRVTHAGVAIRSVLRGDSPNYLFVYLSIASNTAPGRITLELLFGGDVVERVSYELRARSPGSAQRQGFDSRDAIYLLMPDRFALGGSMIKEQRPNVDLSDEVDRSDPDARHGGDLEGIRQRLGYIASLGFTQIWNTPVTENAQPRFSYHGYAITDQYRIDPRLGSLEDYRKLVMEADAHGLGVIHDIVLNHVGHRHRWVADPPTRDWLNHATTGTRTNHAHISVQDPHGAVSDRESFVAGWFDGNMPDLNVRQPLLGDYLIQNTLWWIEEIGLSGIRQDTYSYADKDFLARWSGRVMSEYPRLGLVGEEMSDHAPMVAYWQRGQMNHDGYRSAMPSMMDFPLLASLRRALTTPEGFQRGWFSLYEALGLDFVYPNPSMLMLFADNHDTTRLMAEVKGDSALWRMGIVFVATAPRIPQFFYGTEFGWHGPDPRRDGVLRADFPGGWVGDPTDGVTGHKLADLELQNQNFLRRLLNWRKNQTLIHKGLTRQYVPENGAYVYFRYDPLRSTRVMVVLHKGHQAMELRVDRFSEMIRPGAVAVDVMTGQSIVIGEALTIAARGFLILEID